MEGLMKKVYYAILISWGLLLIWSAWINVEKTRLNKEFGEVIELEKQYLDALIEQEELYNSEIKELRERFKGIMDSMPNPPMLDKRINMHVIRNSC